MENEARHKPTKRAATMILAGVVAAATLAAAVIMSDPALAATFNVTKTADTNDGTCAADCSLREAIVAANASAGPDTINIPTGKYNLTLGGDDDNAAAGDLDIQDDVTIVGAGARATTIDAGGIDRVFHIVGSSITVRISKVAISGGDASFAGGGIRSSGENVNLTITESSIIGNSAVTEGGGRGGGIHFESGTLNIVKSAISGNTAGDAFGSGAGGGIYTESGQATITNSTISGNTAEDAEVTILSNRQFNPGDGVGGGVHNQSATVGMLNVTINNNEASFGANINNASANPFNVQNTIVSNPVVGNNCSVNEPLTSLGNNLDEDDTCALTGPNDINGDPNLGPLQNNAGPTNTHALLLGSPAINTANTAAAPATDQRGVSRPQPMGGRADIGAYERRVVPPPVVPPPVVPPPVVPPPVVPPPVVPPPPVVADLAVRVAAPARVMLGRNFRYTATTTNRGPDAARNVTARTVVPRSVRIVRVSANCRVNPATPRVVRCNLGNMRVGAVRRFIITVKPVRVGTVRLRSVSVNSATPDPNALNNRISQSSPGQSRAQSSQEAPQTTVARRGSD